MRSLSTNPQSIASCIIKKQIEKYDLEKTIKQVWLFVQLTWNQWSVKDEYISINMNKRSI